MAETNKGEILTDEDIHFLKTSPAFQKLIKHYQNELDRTRKEVDEIDVTGLPLLQGRIISFKSILSLFNSIYYE